MFQFIFRGVTIRSMGEIKEIFQRITTGDEAREFMTAYREWSKYADANIRYLIEIADSERAEQWREWLWEMEV